MSPRVPPPPEESRLLRLVVVAAVAIGVVAAAVQSAVPVWLALLAVPLLPAAATVAHRNRHGAPAWVKATVAVVVPLALLRLAGSITAIRTLDEARFTLAELFVVVQVAHALDLPRRRDLYVSLGSSLVLLAVAASLSQDMRFAVSLAAWAATALAALVLAHRSALAAGTVAIASPPHAGRADAGHRETAALGRHVVRGVAVAALAGVAVFLVVPPPTRGGELALPFRIGGGSGSPGGGLLRMPDSATPDPDEPGGGRARGATYYGVSPRMDLRVRGELPDELVMRVRADAPAMWRGAVFDSYDGDSWVGDEGRGRDLGPGPRFRLPARDTLGPRRTTTQTFFVEADLPTAIYAPAEPVVLYFPSAASLDRFGLPRADVTLDDGLVYSVSTSRGTATPEQLRTAGPPPPRVAAPYLGLPAALPDRVHALAREITAGATNDYDRVRRIEAHLRDEYRYRLDSPVPPAGRDAVDHFLFDAREGFCEQFAAAMAVLARSLGIPARVAAGYVPGSFNPLTGYYSVRGTDAHAWVEVYHRGYGWYAYDPTSSVPAPRRSLLDRVPLVQAARWVAEQVADLAPLARAVAAAGVVTAVAGLAFLAVRRRRRRLFDDASGPLRARPVVPRGPATAALERLDAALRAAGTPRRPWETPAEVLTRARAAGAVAAVEREAYAAARPDDAAAQAAAAEIDDAIRLLSPAPPR